MCRLCLFFLNNLCVKCIENLKEDGAILQELERFILEPYRLYEEQRNDRILIQRKSLVRESLGSIMELLL